ncbi:MAG: DNA helicase UvrD [Oscillatoriales cyanobacterium]|nr:MAG: DNA helicase UvrD [Oscillatoriales cyanobacterium]
MPLTPQQARAALTPGSVAVTAGAGTGKTFVLAERYLYYLRDRGYSPLEVVAVTFTDKAAQELKSRIRSFVRAQHPDRLNWLAELEAAPISTLHSLAKRVCEEHPDKAKVPASFSIIDNIEAPIWRMEQIGEALAALPAEIYDIVPYSQLKRAIDALLNDSIAARQALDCLPEDWETVWGDIAEQMRDRVLTTLLDDPRWGDCYYVLNNTVGKAGDKLEEHRLTALASMIAIEDRRELQQNLDAIQAIRTGVGSVKNWPPGDKDRVNSTLKTLKELTKKIQEKGLLTITLGDADRVLAMKLPAIRQAFHLVYEHLRQAKHRQRILTFDDLEVGAITALDYDDVCEYYRDRFQAFLVDEFQDTNPVQAQIVKALTGLNNSHVKPANLTIVGDVKQSIYRFRRADVRVFLDFSDRITAGGGDRVEMSLCFRTHDRLIQQINQIFKPLLHDIHQDLDASRQDAPDDRPPVEVWTLEAPRGVTVDARRRVEGRKIAEWIETAVRDQLPVVDRDSDQLRPIQYGDIAILGRAWTVLQLYGDVLEGCGVPVSIVGGDSLLDTREAKDLLVLLRWLADDTDDLSLVAVLRSPFFAVSDRTLARIARETQGLMLEGEVSEISQAQTVAVTPDQMCGNSSTPSLSNASTDENPTPKPRRASWWQRLNAWDWSQDTDFADLPTPIAILADLRDRRDDPSRLLQIADRLTGYTATIGNLPGAARRLADWRGMVELVAKLEAKDRSLFGVVRQLDRAIDGDVKIPRLPLEADNAVSLMTVHKSKGLEWPVVFVANLNAAGPANTVSLNFDPDWGVAFTWDDETSGDRQTPVLFRWIADLEQEAEEAEAIRLLYVALTRARDRLILTGNAPSQGYLDRLRPGLEAADISMKLWDYDEDDAVIVPPPPPPITRINRPLLIDPIAWMPSELPAQALRDYHQCPQRFAFRYRDGHPGLDATSRQRDRLLSLVRQLIPAPDLIQAAATLETSPSLRDRAIALVERFRTLTVLEAERDLTRVSQAFGRSVRVELDGITIYGTIDHVAQDWIGVWTIDEIDADTQASTWVEAWIYAQALPMAPVRVVDLATARKVELTRIELTTFEPIVRLIVTQILAGQFAATPSDRACLRCPYAEICPDRYRSFPNPQP